VIVAGRGVVAPANGGDNPVVRAVVAAPAADGSTDALIAELRGLQGIVKVTGLNLAQQTETKEGA